MTSLGTFNLSGLFVLGIALLVATGLVYGPRRRRSGDSLRRVLVCSGWFLVVTGLAGMTFVFASFASPLLIVIAAFVTVWSFLSFHKHEHLARMGQIAIALDKRLPLTDVLGAMGRERTSVSSWKPRAQSERMSSGATLYAALQDTRDLPGVGPAMSLGVGASWGGLERSFREALRADAEQEITLRGDIGRFVYLYVVLAITTSILVFMVIKIMPVLQKMLIEFDIPAGSVLSFLVLASSLVASNFYYFVPPAVLFVFVSFVGILYFGRLPRRFAWLVSWVPSSADGAWVMRGLSWAVRSQQPMPDALRSIAKYYDRIAARSRMDRAATAIEGGQPWVEALNRVGLIAAADAAVLNAAERVGNLEWALREQAMSVMRRRGMWLKRILTLLFPFGVIAMAVPVFLLCVAMFEFLVAMIHAIPANSP